MSVEYNIVFINCIQSLMGSVDLFSKLVLYKAGQYINIISSFHFLFLVPGLKGRYSLIIFTLLIFF